LAADRYEDIFALPDHVVGEIVDGELYVSPRFEFFPTVQQPSRLRR
jgi:hypothetical protein